MDLAIITTCSRRKRVETEEELAGINFVAGSLPVVAEKWTRARRSAVTKMPAEDLYVGRGFFEARKAASAVGADLWVISAGYGLIHKSTLISSYDITISPNSPQSLNRLVTSDNVCLDQWWTCINRGKQIRTITGLIESFPKTLFIIGVSRSYFKMIEKDLSQISTDDLNRVRLCGLSDDVVHDLRVRNVLLPYDDRLESLGSPFAGTRSDFPQRIIRHFTEKIWRTDRSNSLTSHKNRVLKILESLEKPEKISRRKLDDKEVLNLIVKHWTDIDGKSGKGLRFLRDDLGVACEQKRFKNLFHEVRRNKLGVKL